MNPYIKHTAFLLTLFNPVSVFAQTQLQDGSTYSIGGSWSPYLVGGLIGILTWLTFYFSEHPIGASSFYATVAGLIGKALAPQHTNKLPYYRENPPRINWGFWFVLATIFGSALAAALSGELSLHGLPVMWSEQYGPDSGLGYASLSFAGGLMMAFGARLAGGCTSGHGLSGTLQLNISSWVAVICFFVGGLVTIRLIY
ncbi:MAG: YeeE/YedE thiosulfate transporter family protein [Nitrospira sp.]